MPTNFNIKEKAIIVADYFLRFEVRYHLEKLLKYTLS